MSVRRWTLLAILLALAAALGGCCCGFDFDFDFDFDLESESESDAPRRPKASQKKSKIRGSLNLGTAEHPIGNTSPAAVVAWRLPRLRPSRYSLGYKLAKTQTGNLLNAFHNYAKKVGHRKINKHRFRWNPPRRCLGGLQCVYDALAEQGRNSVTPLAKLFLDRATKGKLNSLQAAQLVVGFVQQIPYKIPAGEPFGVKPPALVVKHKWGDCDSKSLLAHMLLGRLGIRSVLVSSNAHKHTLLGVALPAAGTTFRHGGSRYAFTELTAKGAPIGQINPKLLRPSDWRVQAMRYNVLKAGKVPAAKRRRRRRRP